MKRKLSVYLVLWLALTALGTGGVYLAAPQLVTLNNVGTLGLVALAIILSMDGLEVEGRA